MRINFFLKNIGLNLAYFVIGNALFFSNALRAQESTKQIFSNFDVGTVGATLSGSFVESCLGASDKECHQHFHCHETGPIPGTLGLQTVYSSLKNQPGVFPAPLMGADALNFSFNCSDAHFYFTPFVIKPDGTVFKTAAVCQTSHTIHIPYPAQTGVYTIFILNHTQEKSFASINIDAWKQNKPKQKTTLSIQPFGKDHDPILMSGEFIYSAMSPRIELFQKKPAGVLLN